MAAAMIVDASALHLASQPATVSGSLLAIGSPRTAQDGKYQSLISSLTNDSEKVQKLMFDRIVEGGKCHECMDELIESLTTC